MVHDIIATYLSKINVPRESFFLNFERDWASEASPTLGCSIEISHDIHIYIYVCMYVCMSSVVYGKTIQKNRMLKCVGRLT